MCVCKLNTVSFFQRPFFSFMFYWLVECFILQSLLNMLLHDELEGKYLCTEITQLHCAVVVYSVCHVIHHLGVTSVERRGRISVPRDPSPWRHLSGAKGAYTPYCGWIVAVSEHIQSAVFVYH